MKYLKKNPSKSFLKNTFYFQYFYLHFGVGDYDNALQYLNEWLNIKSNIERTDLQALSRILNLLIHKEMGNTFLIQSLTRSASRYLKKNTKPTQYEEAVLRYFRRTINSVNLNEEKVYLAELLKDIEMIKSSGKENKILNLFDMEGWVMSKLENKSFGNIKQTYK